MDLAGRADGRVVPARISGRPHHRRSRDRGARGRRASPVRGRGHVRSARHVVPAGRQTARSRCARALAGTSEEVASVAVHDAAWPLVTPQLLDRCVSEPNTELRRRGRGRAGRRHDQGGRRRGARACHAAARPLWRSRHHRRSRRGRSRGAGRRRSSRRAYDDAQLVEAAGAMCASSSPRQNLKVTTAHDMRVAVSLLSLSRCCSREARGSQSVMPTDFHTHLSAPMSRGHPARALLHRGQRRRYLELAAGAGRTELGFSEHVVPLPGGARGVASSSRGECAQDRSRNTSNCFVESMEANGLSKLGIEVGMDPGREHPMAA